MLRLAEIGTDNVRGLFELHLGGRCRQLAEKGWTDFSLRLAGSADRAAWRLRVNLQCQGGGLAAAVRSLPRRVPTLEELNLPPILGERNRVPPTTLDRISGFAQQIHRRGAAEIPLRSNESMRCSLLVVPLLS
jgi:hypothetical protein